MEPSEPDSHECCYSALTSHSPYGLDYPDALVSSWPDDAGSKLSPRERISHEIRGCHDFENELRRLRRGSDALYPREVELDERPCRHNTLLEYQHDPQPTSNVLLTQNRTKNEIKQGVANSETELELPSQQRYTEITNDDSTRLNPAQSTIQLVELALQAVHLDPNMTNSSYGDRAPTLKQLVYSLDALRRDELTGFLKLWDYRPKFEVYDPAYINTSITDFCDKTFQLAPWPLFQEGYSGDQVFALGTSITT